MAKIFYNWRARCQNKSRGHGQHTMNALNLFNSQIAEITIAYSHKVRPADMKKITSSKDAFDFVLPNWLDTIEHHESFGVMLLSRANKIKGVCWIGHGGISGTVADPKMVFQAALKANASSVILLHNHPSGNTNPSEADVRLTRKIKNAGEFLDLAVLDHLICTADSYFSFADNNRI